MTTANKNLVAKTILEQLGGNKFIAMTGARQFGAGEKSLTFKIGRNNSKANHVRITLNCMDTYDMAFIKVYKFDAKTVSAKGSIYAEDLQRVFTGETGLNTSL